VASCLLLVAPEFYRSGWNGFRGQGHFPNTDEVGRAAVEYRDDAMQVVAAYYYSQRSHDSLWLLIQAAVATEELITLPREAFQLVTPDGRPVPLATQRQFGRDPGRTRMLLQNATTTRHDKGS